MVTTYRRSATCTEGHAVLVSFNWDPDSVEVAAEYSKPCPTAGCSGRVVGKVPVGADFSTLTLSTREKA